MMKHAYCNFCKHAKIKPIGYEENARYNLYCERDNNMIRLVDASIKHDDYVKCPNWCGERYTKESESLSYTDRVSRMRNFKPFIAWDDIKVGEVYHIPQIPGEERKDIIITNKASTSLMYRVIGAPANISYTMYLSSLIRIFLVKNKLKNVTFDAL